MSASWIAVKKLSGVAVPSCSCGSSQRDANPACQARTILPLAAALTGAEPGISVATTAVRMSAPATQGTKPRDTSRGNLMSNPPIRGVVPAKGAVGYPAVSTRSSSGRASCREHMICPLFGASELSALQALASQSVGWEAQHALSAGGPGAGHDDP